MASMLATLKITKATDNEGNIVEPDVKYDNGFFRCVRIQASYSWDFKLTDDIG
jgi:hypothetical protein